MRVIIFMLFIASAASADTWKTDPIWHDGLVEKATYSASRPIYGKDRKYEAVFFTNKEQHDLKTLTKANGSAQTLEVWKHNQIEVVPTPNYDYKFVTTTHLAVDTLQLTRLDFSSQEFCGTTFKQYQRRPEEEAVEYWSFSYMPESGRVLGKIEVRDRTVIPQDSLPLWLRDFDFQSRGTVKFWMLPPQKSTRATAYQPLPAEVRFAGEDGETWKLEVFVSTGDSEGGPLRAAGTYWMEKDFRHVMRRAVLPGGQTYDLKKVERVDYWTITTE